MSGNPLEPKGGPGQPAVPNEFEELDFSIDEEGWNEYTLGDGAKIRGRVFLVKIIRDPFNPDPNNMRFHIPPPTWSVDAPIHLRGPPQPGLTVEERKNIAKYEVKIVNSHEPWNKYRILKTGQRLKIKLSIDEIHRYVDRFDNTGCPAYYVPNGVAVSLSPPGEKSNLP